MKRIPENIRQRAKGCWRLDFLMWSWYWCWCIRVVRPDVLRTYNGAAGRPRVTNRIQDRYILNQQLRDRFRTATTTAAAKTPGFHNEARLKENVTRNEMTSIEI